MARGRSGGQRPIPGFRPGKEPPALRKQRARKQLGGDASWSQQKLIDALADRTPDEARSMMARTRAVTLIVAITLAVAGAALYLWATVAGVIAHVLAVAAFLFWLQLRRKQRDFEAMAEMVGGGRPGAGKGKGGKGGRGGKGKAGKGGRGGGR